MKKLPWTGWFNRRTLTVFVAAILLVSLYAAADWRAVMATLSRLHPGYLLAALLLFVPQTLVSALRWRTLVKPVCEISVLEGVRQTLAASALNLVVPSKLGDLSKAAMLPEGRGRDRLALALRVTLEKAADVAALASMLLVGQLAISGTALMLSLAVVWGLYLGLRTVGPASRAGRDIRQLAGVKRPVAEFARIPMSEVWRLPLPLAGSLFPAGCLRSPARLAEPTTVTDRNTDRPCWAQAGSWLALVPYSLSLWCLHLAQIDCLLKSAGVFVAWSEVLARVPVAIFAGLIPISSLGIGTRDAALIWMFADIAPSSTMAAVGLLTALRYLVPGAAGIPLLGRGGNGISCPCRSDANPLPDGT